MAHWGMAMAQGPHINMDLDGDVDIKASCANVQAGLKVAGAAGRERGYLEAAATRCPNGEPQPYITAMKALAAGYPDDGRSRCTPKPDGAGAVALVCER
jgi:hypothetical protein